VRVTPVAATAAASERGDVTAIVIPLVYLVAGVLFILGLKLMSRVRTARRGNAMAAGGMVLAVGGAVADIGGAAAWGAIIASSVMGAVAGVGAALRTPPVAATRLASFLAVLTGAGAAVAGVSLIHAAGGHLGALITDVGVARAAAVATAVLLGAIAVGGGLPGVLETGRPAPGRAAMTSLVNGVSGLATALAGFGLRNPALVIVGGLVGTSALVVGRIMAGASNRTLRELLSGGAAATGGGSGGAVAGDYANVRSCGPEEAAMVLENARTVVFVPGYGMAVAQAQVAVSDLAKVLEKRGARVTYAIHPVAGVVPGHMNILLDEAGVPIEKLADLDTANAELAQADAALVLGANDVVNPAAETEPHSPVYGMPIIDVRSARSVFVVKRSLRAGFSGARNQLFEAPSTMMIFGDVKKVAQALTTELKGGGH